MPFKMDLIPTDLAVLANINLDNPANTGNAMITSDSVGLKYMKSKNHQLNHDKFVEL
jgi:hypothetical protein